MIISFAENVVFVFVSTRVKHIENAKQFLNKNVIEIIVYAACIHDLIEITLYNSIKRQKDEAKKASLFEKREKHNKILSQNEINTFHDLIRFLLICDILSRHNLIFAVISHLKRAKESDVSSRR
jgi:hypothetical protein